MPETTKRSVHAKNVRTGRLLTALIVLILCISLFTSQLSALAEPVFQDGNPALKPGCIRIDPVEERTYTIASDGVKTNPAEGFTPADFSISIDLTDGPGGQTLAFTSTKYYVKGIVVKGGSAANIYTFDPAVDEASGLHAPVNASGKYADVSHIDICFGDLITVPGINVEKFVFDGHDWVDADSATGPMLLETGGNVKFRFVVKNTGNVQLTDITLADSDFPVPEAGIHKILDPEQSFAVEIEAPWQAGQHTNTATATGKFGQHTYTDTDDANYFGVVPEVHPAIDVEKYVSIDGGTTWVDADTATGPETADTGARPMFKFWVKNTGDVQLTDITLTDSDFTLPEAEIHKILGEGEAFEVIVEAPWHAGQHENTATATGKYGAHTYTDTDKAHYFGVVTSIDIEKQVSVDGGKTWADADEPDGPILDRSTGIDPMFKLTVTNTGNVPLTSIKLIDPPLQALIDAKAYPDSLAASKNFDVVIDGEWLEGKQVNVATVFGYYGETKVQDTDAACYVGMKKAKPGISVEKTVADAADGDYGKLVEIEEGQFAFYKVIVKNTGNVALEDVMLTDSRVTVGTVAAIDGTDSKAFVKGTDNTAVLALGTLAPGQEVVVTYTYQTGLEDVGVPIDNEAMVVGTYGEEIVSDSDSATIIVNGIPLAVSGIKLEKLVENVTAGGSPDETATGFAGDVFRYTIKVTNTGETDLSNVVLRDNRAIIGASVAVSMDVTFYPATVLTWVDDGTGHARLDIGDLPAGAVLFVTYQYTADKTDEGKTLTNLAHVTAEFQGLPLESSDTASIVVQTAPPQTGESDGRTLGGIALLLAGSIALTLRRKFRLEF